jgi:general nucleoside transport system permease protein
MLPMRIAKRQEPLGWGGSCFVLLTALALSLLLSAFLLYLGGTSPLQGLGVLFRGAFGSRWALEDSVLKAIPIFLCSLGVAVAFRLKIWNIGAEGQFALGAIGATWIALSFPGWPKYLLLPAMIAMAMTCGGLWGLIPGLSPPALEDQ